MADHDPLAVEFEARGSEERGFEERGSEERGSEARGFEEHRAHLRNVAYRILGSAADAEDAVQEAWLRLSRTDVSDVLNLQAWLTTVVGRVALNMLESRGTRREEMSAEPPEPAAVGPRAATPPPGPEDEALLGD